MSTRQTLGALLHGAISAVFPSTDRARRQRLAVIEPLEWRQLLAAISISNPSQLEGDSGTSAMIFDVSLSGPVAQTVTVQYSTQDGTATANEDYLPASGTVTFAPNQTQASIAVQIKGDTNYEPDEILVVNLTNAVNASIANGMGLGIILNDDSPDGGGTNPPPTPVQAPYPGPNAATLPGTIEFENYDAGGEGLAYHDSDYGNQGGVYRSDNVDIDKTSTGGYYVGWTKAGEWMEYSVNVATAGTYSAQFRVASGTAGGTFHLTLDGQSITPTITVPNTGGWQTWTTLTVNNVSLASTGNHTLRVAFDFNGAGGFVGNFDSMTFGQATQPPQPPPTTTETPYNASPYNVGDTIQAENFNKGGEGLAYHDNEPANLGGQYRATEGVDIQTTTDTGGGYAVGYTKAGEWLDYFVNASAAGTYNMDFRVASAGTGGAFHVEVDGAAVAGSVQVPNTGSWNTWQTITKTGVSLSAGQHNIRIKFDTVGASGFTGNLNWFKVYATTVTPPPASGQTPFTGTPFAAGQTIQASDFDKGGEGVAYHDIEPANLGFQYRLTEGVDIQAIPNSNPKLYSVGWTRAGEWIEYTVNIATAGTYNLEAAAASLGTGGTFHVEFNGVNKTGAITVPNTGGWQTWQTLSKSVTLDAGVQVMRVAMDSAGSTGFIGNFNWLRFTAASTPAAQPLLVEAENYDQGGEGVAYHDATPTNDFGSFRATEGVDVEACSDTGGGYDIGNIEAGEWVRYTINLASASTYTLSARVASAGAGGTFHVEFDGQNLTGPLTIPNTGDWQTWQTISKSGLTLAAGQHTMRVVFDTASATTGWVGNVNWLKLA